MTDAQTAAEGKKYQTLRAELDPLFAAFRDVLLKQLEEAPPTDPASILEMHRGLQNMAKLKEAISNVVNNGLYAEAALRQAQMHRG